MARTVLAVFDLDGTLVDSRRDLAESANEMLAGYNAAPIAEDAVVRMVGCGAATLVRRVLETAGLDVPLDKALARFLTVYDQRLVNHTRPYAGIPGLLDELHHQQITMALLTNKPLEQSAAILAQFHLSKYFRWIVGGDGLWPRKPSPDGLRYLMKQASLGPSETVLIGDSTVDLQTSRNAGVRICLARYGFGFADIASDQFGGGERVVDSPAEIAGVLREPGWRVAR